MVFFHLSPNFGSIIVGIIIIISIFTIINYGLIINGHIKPTSAYDSSPMSGMIESAYFSTINLSTSGYGDIYPTTHTGQIVVMIEHLFIICIFIKALMIGG